MRTAVMIALLSPPLLCADEIILRDGQKIEWTSIRANGDSYELETKQGKRVVVKRVDVEKIVPSNDIGSPLTGAAFTFDKKRKTEIVELLSRIDLRRDVLGGTWRFTNGALVGVAPNPVAPVGLGHGKLATQYSPPEEYDLTVKVERRQGADDIAFGLVGGGRQFVFSLDAYSIWNGIFEFDGKGPNETNLGVQGRFFTNGVQRTIVFMVRKEAFIVNVDGKDYWSWKPDWSRLSVHRAHAIPAKDVFFLSIYNGTFAITQFTVTSPRDSAQRK